MPTFYVRGNHAQFSFEDQVFVVIDGKVDLPAGATWYADLVGVLLFTTPNSIPSEPLPSPAPRAGAFFDVSDAQPEPEVPVGFAPPLPPVADAPADDTPPAPWPVGQDRPAADAAVSTLTPTRKPRVKRQP